MPSMDYNPRMSMAGGRTVSSQQKKQKEPDEDAFMTLVCAYTIESSNRAVRTDESIARQGNRRMYQRHWNQLHAGGP